jgi:hypothetical protein
VYLQLRCQPEVEYNNHYLGDFYWIDVILAQQLSDDRRTAGQRSNKVTGTSANPNGNRRNSARVGKVRS